VAVSAAGSLKTAVQSDHGYTDCTDQNGYGRVGVGDSLTGRVSLRSLLSFSWPRVIRAIRGDHCGFHGSEPVVEAEKDEAGANEKWCEGHVIGCLVGPSQWLSQAIRMEKKQAGGREEDAVGKVIRIEARIAAAAEPPDEKAEFHPEKREDPEYAEEKKRRQGELHG
jgi:hypothetical protein